MTTIAEIYEGINPLPAMLSAKGKVKPNVDFHVEANVGIRITMSWVKPYVTTEWDRNYEVFFGNDFAEALDKARKYINALPSAEQAKLNNFMRQLGKVIDHGKEDGIEVEFLNPLLDTMKRLSENIITYQPKAV